MKLNTYLKENKITYSSFLKKANKHEKFSASALAKWSQGKRIPRKKEMTVIHKITNGKVSANDFYDIDCEN